MSYDFYSLLPLVMRLRSETATPNANEESVLQRIVYMLEQEAEVVSDQIDGITDLVQPDECPIAYLPLLARLLGIHYSADWSETKRRLFVKAAGLIWHIKATRLSWTTFLEAHGHEDYFPWELWKSQVYEEFDYSLWQDYGHPYKAARVDIRRPWDTTGNHGLFVDSIVEDVRPAHVLLRRPGEYASEESVTFPTPADVGYDGEPLDAFLVAATWSDNVGAFDDGSVFFEDDYPLDGTPGLYIETNCANVTCETSCQGSCTGSCEMECQYGSCEVACQTFCQQNCQLSCEYSCQAACEGTCENTTCQIDSCQVACQTNCEPGIETTPPASCVSDCQAWCESNEEPHGEPEGDPCEWWGGG